MKNLKPKMLYNKYPRYKKKCYGVKLGLTESSVVVYFMKQKLVVKLGRKLKEKDTKMKEKTPISNHNL